MRTVILSGDSIHKGDLILVNRSCACPADSTGTMIPISDGKPPVLLHRAAAALLIELIKHIHAQGSIVPVSGWRSVTEQKEIWEVSVAENGVDFTKKYVAVPGHSEHQTGLAVDLGLKGPDLDFIRPAFPYTGICQTFREEAPNYGFVERYPQGKEFVTGIGHECWHFRYVGIPHAAVMTEKKLTLEEYLLFLRKYPHGQRAYRYENRGFCADISFCPAEQTGTRLNIHTDKPCAISGNNMDGYIITEWR